MTSPAVLRDFVRGHDQSIDEVRMIHHPSLLASGIACVLLLAACDLFVDDATRVARAAENVQTQQYRAAEIELKNVLRSDPHNVEARVLLGQALLHSGDAAAAVKELQRGRELGAQAEDYLPALARALLREARHNELVELDAGDLEDAGQRAAVIALIGRAEAALGNSAAARRRFDQAVALVPEQPDALIGLSQIARDSGADEAAAAHLQKLLASRPDDAEGLAALARLQFSQHDYAAAEASFNRAFDATTDGQPRERIVYLSGLIDAQLAQGETTGARATAERLLELGGQHPVAQLQAARVDYALADYDSVIERTGQAIARLPEYEPARLLQAAAALAQGNRVLAVTQLQAVININPGNEQARKLLAQAHMEMNSPDAALEVLQPLLCLSQQDPKTLALAGSASLRSGKQQSGLDLIDRSVEIGSDNPALALQSASALLAAGEIERAIAVLEALPESERVDQRDLLLVLAELRAGNEDAARARARAPVDNRPDDAAAQRLAAGFHLAVQEYDEARKHFEIAYELAPDEHSPVLNLARIDKAQGNPEAAVARLQQLLEREPGNLMALTALAQLAEQRGDREEAIRLVEQSLQANPDAAEPALRLARYFLATGDLERAEQLATRVVRNAPHQAAGHEMLAAVLLRDGRASEAASSLQQALAVAPNSATAHLQLGRAQLQMGELDAAHASFEAAVKNDPQSVEARVAMVRAVAQRGDIDAASALAASMTEDFPQRAEPLILRGDLAVEKGEFNAALGAYDEAAAIAPSRALAARRSEVRRRLGQSDAEATLEKWVRDNPDDLQGRQMLAQAYVAAGRLPRAVEELEAVMAASPDAAVAARIALVHERRGNFDDAARWLQRAQELEPDNATPKLALASVELRRGNAGRAAQLATELRKSGADSVEVHQMEGAALFAQQRFADSAAAYARAAAVAPSQPVTLALYEARKNAGDADSWRLLEQWLADHPDDIPVAMQLALHYDGDGLHDEAIELYRNVLYADPDNFVVLNNIAWVYYKRGEDGDIKRGINSAARAHELRSDVPAVVDTYGWLLLQDERLDEALPLLKKAAVSAPDEPEIGYHYAVALHRNNETADARALLNRLLSENEDFDSRSDAEALLARL